MLRGGKWGKMDEKGLKSVPTHPASTLKIFLRNANYNFL